MVFKTYTPRYIIKYLTCDIRFRSIYDIQFTPIKLQSLIPCVLWNYTFDACVESWNIIVTCLCVLLVTICNIFKIFLYIKIYSYDITRAHQYCILPYSTRLSLLIKIAYSYIQAYPPHVYHVVHLSHYWANVCTLTYRPMNPVCTL